MLPTFPGGASTPTQANTPPVPRPSAAAMATNVRPAGTSPSGCRFTTQARTATPVSEVITTGLGPNLSASTPPTGRASTAASAKPAVRAPAPLGSKLYTSRR